MELSEEQRKALVQLDELIRLLTMATETARDAMALAMKAARSKRAKGFEVPSAAYIRRAIENAKLIDEDVDVIHRVIEQGYPPARHP